METYSTIVQKFRRRRFFLFDLLIGNIFDNFSFFFVVLLASKILLYYFFIFISLKDKFPFISMNVMSRRFFVVHHTCVVANNRKIDNIWLGCVSWMVPRECAIFIHIKILSTRNVLQSLICLQGVIHCTHAYMRKSNRICLFEIFGWNIFWTTEKSTVSW